jgi:hypothetical protein
MAKGSREAGNTGDGVRVDTAASELRSKVS